MTLMRPKAGAPPVQTAAPIQATTPQYRGVTVDSRVTPLRQLLQHVEGSSWTVQYYSQIVDRDTPLQHHAIDGHPVYQQYSLIHNFELKVTRSLDPVQDSESKGFDVMGSATVIPGLVPNVGDTFLADIGDGREGIFAVTASERKTHLKDSYYVIEYQLRKYSDRDEELRQDLARKVIQEFHFVKDYLQHGQNPIITSDLYQSRAQLLDAYQDLLGHYFHDFFSDEYQMVLVPDQKKPTFDPYLQAALLDMVTTSDHPVMRRIKRTTMHHTGAARSGNVWEALMRGDSARLLSGFERVAVARSVHFANYPEHSGIFFSGIHQLIYPIDRRTDVDAGYQLDRKVPVGNHSTITVGGHRFDNIERLMDSRPLAGFTYGTNDAIPAILPDIAPVTQDDYYVFTEAFYRRGGKFNSRLEMLANQLIYGQPVDRSVLLHLARAALRWPNVERYYYIPVLFALLHTTTRTN